MPPNLIHLSHIDQEHSGECLAVCADMVLLHIGQRKRRWRLHRLLKIQSEYGTPFYNIRNLRRLGVRVRFYDNASFETIQQELEQGNPCIVPVLANEFPHWPDEIVQHAIVVVGMDEKFVWIHDPMVTKAPFAVSAGDFDLAWFGMNERLAVILP